jgi:hypothetical protein
VNVYLSKLRGCPLASLSVLVVCLYARKVLGFLITESVFLHSFLKEHYEYKLITVAARSKAWVCGRSLTGIAGSNPAGSMDVCLL